MSVAHLLSEHDAARARAVQADARADAAIAGALAALRALRGGVPVSAEALSAAREAARALPGALTREQKGVGAALNRLGRAIDSATATGLSELCAPSVRLRVDKVNESVSDHLFREGLFGLGRAFAREADVEVDDAMIAPFKDLHHILAAFRAGDLQPAIRWAASQGERLRESDSDLEIRLHRLAYLRLLQDGRAEEALAYARLHFRKFPEHVKALGGLMTCMLFARRLGNSPYQMWVSDMHRDDIERALTREYCKMLNLGPESSLVTIVRCGAKAIPNLLKASRVAPNWRELGTDDVLPVEVDIGRECRFHSIFTCPVSREETTDGSNVPMMLPCGHVLSKASISRLPKGPQRFKCPYCPREQQEADCEELRF